VLAAIMKPELSLIFDEPTQTEYKKKFEALWFELVDAHSSMFVVEKLLEFPSELLLPPHHKTFFPLLLKNFVNQIVLIIHKSLGDQRTDVLTFTTFKKWICDKCRDSYTDQVRLYFEQVDDRTKISTILEKTRVLRHNLIAHFNIDYAIHRKKREEAKIYFHELRLLLDETDKLMNALCFEGGVSMLPPWYTKSNYHRSGVDSRADIECFLDAIAKDSALLKMPEEQRNWWHIYKKELTDEEKKVFNYWRRRVGLSEEIFDQEINQAG